MFRILFLIDEIYWKYIGFSVICVVGIYLTIISRGMQFRAVWNIKASLKEMIFISKEGHGIHPIKLVLASAGGMIGVGNIVGICMAICIGGPGSIFWIWVASFFGTIIKYSEAYLGMKYRTQNARGGYDGGIIYYIQHAFRKKYLAYIVAFLLCIYGVEIYQFAVLVDRIRYSLQNVRQEFIVAILLIGVLYSSIGGISRLANICTILMPIFLLIYISTSLYIIFLNINNFYSVVSDIFYSAFTGTAAIGGFVGSTMTLAAYLGVSKGVYSGDIGVGYDSIVHSESKELDPAKQARLAIYALLCDTFVCTITTMVVAFTGAWYKYTDIPISGLVSFVINQYIPYGDYFMTIMVFFAAFSTIIAYLTVGIKAARFISYRYGYILYIIYAISAFLFFGYSNPDNVILVMSLSGGILVLLNLCSIIKLRNEIKFEI